MEETLTIPRSDSITSIGKSLAVIGLGTMAVAGQEDPELASLLGENLPSTGGNSAWLASVLPVWDPFSPTDLYALCVEQLDDVGSLPDITARGPSDKDTLQHIKHVLSLTGQQLAAAMGVSRTAVYQWMDESSTMRERNRERLDKLRQIADRWMERAGKPLNRVSSVTGEARAQVKALLSSGSEGCLQEAAAYLDQLADLVDRQGARPRSVLEIAEERGWKPLPGHLRRSAVESRVPSASPPPEEDQ